MLFKDWEFYNITKTNMRSFFPLTNQWAEKQRDRYLYLFIWLTNGVRSRAPHNFEIWCGFQCDSILAAKVDEFNTLDSWLTMSPKGFVEIGCYSAEFLLAAHASLHSSWVHSMSASSLIAIVIGAIWCVFPADVFDGIRIKSLSLQVGWKVNKSYEKSIVTSVVFSWEFLRSRNAVKKTIRKFVTPELVCSGHPRDSFNPKRWLIDTGGSKWCC